MRRTYVNVMLVCEGYAEDAFARAIRDLYLPRDCGLILQRRNARGFGGARALEIALTLKAEGNHQNYGVLIDIDAHWGAPEREIANNNGIHVIENSPCLEATLLRTGGHRVPATTAQCKSAFERIYGSPADRDGIIERNFRKEQFDAARTSVEAIDRMLRFIQR